MTIVTGGTEILVSTTNADTQANQQITTLADGGFAVTWTSRVASGDWEVRGRVFAADGTPVNDSDFLISPSVPHNFTPQITALADGGFAVTDGILGRVFAADGTLVRQRFRSRRGLGTGEWRLRGGVEFVRQGVLEHSGRCSRRTARRSTAAISSSPRRRCHRVQHADHGVGGRRLRSDVGILAAAKFTARCLRRTAHRSTAAISVSTYGGNHAVTALANGGFVVTWTRVTTTWT